MTMIFSFALLISVSFSIQFSTKKMAATSKRLSFLMQEYFMLCHVFINHVIISCSTCCLFGPVKATWVCASFDSNLVIISCSTCCLWLLSKSCLLHATYQYSSLSAKFCDLTKVSPNLLCKFTNLQIYIFGDLVIGFG